MKWLPILILLFCSCTGTLRKIENVPKRVYSYPGYQGECFIVPKGTRIGDRTAIKAGIFMMSELIDKLRTKDKKTELIKAEHTKKIEEYLKKERKH